VINSQQPDALGAALTENAMPAWLRAATSRVSDNERRISGWFVLCLVLSLLLHGALLMIPAKVRIEPPLSPMQAALGPLQVHLASRPPPAAPPVPPVNPALPAPDERRVISAHKRASAVKPAFTVHAPDKQIPPPSVPSPDDFSARLEAKRAARQAEEAAAAQENAEAAGAQSSLNDNIRDNLNRALKPSNAMGMFYDVKVGAREGSFVFNGAYLGGGANWHHTVPVDAGEGGNVRLAIAEEMAKICRKYWPGKVPIESHRFGRVITLSTLPEDNTALVKFWMKEVFDEESQASVN
jgi:hypothetical protein